MSLNSVRAPDASKEFTLKLPFLSDLGELAAVARKKAVTLDVVTVLEFGRYYSHLGSSKEMLDGISRRFPRLKLLRVQYSTGNCSTLISSFLDTYQVRYFKRREFPK